MKRSVITILVISMLVSLSACSGESSKISNQENNNEENTAIQEMDTEQETEPEKLKPDIPDTTYNGASLRFLSNEVVPNVVHYYSEVSSREMNGEIMNDTVFERTVRMEETYDIKIIDETSSDVIGTYQNSYMADEQNWDIIIPFMEVSFPLAANGYIADLKQIPYIDLEKPWWDTQIAKAMEINNSLYCVIGAMNTWTDSHTFAVLFNKELAIDFNVDPYEMVNNNTWTLDNFAAISEKVYTDLNGNGTVDETDRFGAVGSFENFEILMIGSDVNVVTSDENGYPTLNITEKLYSAAEKIYGILNSESFMLAQDYVHLFSDPWNDGIRVNFGSGNSLFYTGGLENFFLFRDYDIDIGLVPSPKYDEYQENYIHSIDIWWSTCIMIPRNSSTTEFTGHMLEALQADSYYSTYSVYYDVIMDGKSMRDEISGDMLDIIRSTRTIDMNFAYKFLNMLSIYKDMLNGNSSDILASRIAAGQSSAETAIAKFIEQYQ